MKKTLEKKLSQTTRRLESRYRRLKDGEGAKKASHKRFFDLADEAIKEGILAQRTVLVPDIYRADVEEYADRFYPEWNLLAIEPDDGDTVTLLLEEKPEFKSFTYTNPELGLTFQRTITRGEVVVDDETLKKQEPELYDDVVEMVPQMKALDEMTDEQRAKVQKYIYRKPPKQRLEPPRRAKEDQLDD